MGKSHLITTPLTSLFSSSWMEYITGFLVESNAWKLDITAGSSTREIFIIPVSSSVMMASYTGMPPMVTIIVIFFDRYNFLLSCKPVP